MRRLGEGGLDDVVPERAVPVGFHVVREGSGELGVHVGQPRRGGLIDPGEQLPDGGLGPGELGEVGKLSGRLGRGGRQTLEEGERLGGVPPEELAARLGELVDEDPVGDGHHDVRGVTHHLDAVVELGGQLLVGQRAEIDGQRPVRSPPGARAATRRSSVG